MTTDADANANDRTLQQLAERIARSDRLRAATLALAQRVEMLDALEQAGFAVNNASVMVVFDGKQVTSVLHPDEAVQIRGGGFVPFTRSEKRV